MDELTAKDIEIIQRAIEDIKARWPLASDVPPRYVESRIISVYTGFTPDGCKKATS